MIQRVSLEGHKTQQTCLYRFGESVLTATVHVGDQSRFGVRFDYPKPCSRRVEVHRVRFEYRNACRGPVEVSRIGFDYRKACSM